MDGYKQFDNSAPWVQLPPDPPKTFQGGNEEDIHIAYINNQKCDHFFYRYSATDIRCKTCPSGWIDNGKFVLENGKIIGRTAS